MAASKFKLYLTPDEYAVLEQSLACMGALSNSVIITAGFAPLVSNKYEIETIRRKIAVHLDKIYDGDIKPEYVPVRNSERQRAKPFNVGDMDLDGYNDITGDAPAKPVMTEEEIKLAVDIGFSKEAAKLGMTESEYNDHIMKEFMNPTTPIVPQTPTDESTGE